MRDYQVRGLNWMISLYENGINGILADEMVNRIILVFFAIQLFLIILIGILFQCYLLKVMPYFGMLCYALCGYIRLVNT